MFKKTDNVIKKDISEDVVENKEVMVKNEEKKQMSEQEFKEKYTKQIPFNGLSSDFKSKFEFIVQELKNLESEAETKKEEFLIKSDLLNKKLSLLVKEGKLTLDQKEFQRTQEVVTNYENLLINLIKEVGVELTFAQSLISQDPPKTLDVLIWESDNVEAFLDNKLKWIKKYIKNVRKDLRVSYSRYNFSFESQIKRLDYLTAYLKNLKEKPKEE